MAKLDDLKGFRGGVIYAAADVLPATVHTWPIEIGEQLGAGHKRYDAIDAVMLSLMKVLALELAMPAKRAAAVLNAQRDAIATAIRAICDEQAASGAWRWAGGPYLHIKVAGTRVRGDVDIGHVIEDDQIAAALADQSSGLGQVVVPLARNVCRTLLSLENVIAGNKSAEAD